MRASWATGMSLGRRAHHRDLAPSLNVAIAPEADGARAREMLAFRELAQDLNGTVRGDSRDQHVGAMVEKSEAMAMISSFVLPSRR